MATHLQGSLEGTRSGDKGQLMVAVGPCHFSGETGLLFLPPLFSLQPSLLTPSVLACPLCPGFHALGCDDMGLQVRLTLTLILGLPVGPQQCLAQLSARS